MKTIFKEIPVIKKYPYFGKIAGISKSAGAVVLFIGESTGIVVENDSCYSLNYFSDGWNEELFTPINAEVTFSS